MMNDIQTTDKMFGIVMSEKGRFCEVGTAVENFERELFTGFFFNIFKDNLYVVCFCIICGWD